MTVRIAAELGTLESNVDEEGLAPLWIEQSCGLCGDVVTRTEYAAVDEGTVDVGGRTPYENGISEARTLIAHWRKVHGHELELIEAKRGERFDG